MRKFVLQYLGVAKCSNWEWSVTVADAACEPQSSGFKSSPDWAQTLMSPGNCSVTSGAQNKCLNERALGCDVCRGDGVNLRGVHGNRDSWGSNEGPGYCGYVSGCPVLVCALHIPWLPLFLSLLFPLSAELVFLLPPIFSPVTPPPLCSPLPHVTHPPACL